MPPTPKFTLDESDLLDLRCPICAHVSLELVQLERLPDYITCGNCSSAFVREEGGQRVMYGKINPEYPSTSQFALRQWVWPEAIDQRAASERPSTPFPPTPPIPEAPHEAEPTPADEVPSLESVDLIEEQLDEPLRPAVEPMLDSKELGGPFGVIEDAPSFVPPSEAQEPVQPMFRAPSEMEPVVEAPPTPVYEPPETDPPLGLRHRVVIRGASVKFPTTICSHCLRSPVKGRVAIIGTLPSGQGVGQRQDVTFNLPLCVDCQKRSEYKNVDERNSRLQAYLLSALAAMILLVVALAVGVDLLNRPLEGVIILAVLAVVGFTVPAWLLLRRIGGFPLPPDTQYVRSTLLIPRESQGLETAFEFRNQGYAERFFEANQEIVLGDITSIKDRSAQTE
jgi:ribosomal protein S27E